jgi:PAS domain S-box-containing protein
LPGPGSPHSSRESRILEAVSFAAWRILGSRSWQHVLDEVLARLGGAAEVSRVHVFAHRKEGGRWLMSPLGEWVDGRTRAFLGDPAFADLLLFDRWAELLGRGEVVAENVRALTPEEREHFVAGDVRSVLIVPIVVGGVWWGEIGFDDCEHERTWRREELDALRAAAGILGAAVERRSAEQAIRASAEQYRLFFDANPLPMWVFDLETLAFLAVNDAAARTYGYEREELLTMTIADIRPPEEVDAIRAYVQTLGSGFDDHGRWKHRRRDGTVIDVEVAGYGIEFEGRRARLVVAQDVSARLALEEKLRQAQKMEAVGRLAGGIAHDFNNILTAVDGYSELALRRLPRDAEVVADIDEIRRAAARATGLTRQLLAFSRQQVHDPAPVEVAEVVADMEPMLRPLIGEDVTFAARLEPGYVLADRSQLEQVLLNLAVNARDAMPAGGELVVESRCVQVADGGELEPGSYVLLAVSDSGLGMDENVLPRIFDPFFTTKGRGEGTGLGLATVYGIVEQSGGHVLVDSEPGRGTTFAVYLPQVEAAAAAAPQARPTLERGHETILLVEDEPSVRELVRRVLEEHGYTVLVAGNGVEALELVGWLRIPIDMLLTDVVMPAMGGPALVERLGADCPPRVLYISGYTGEDSLADGTGRGDLDLLLKPFSPAELVRRVRALLDRP